MRQLPVYFIGNCPLLQHDKHEPVALGQRRAMNVDASVGFLAGPAEIDLVFIDCRATFANLLDERGERRSERQQPIERLPDEQRLAEFEEGLRGGVGVLDDAIAGDGQNRVGQSLKHA